MSKKMNLYFGVGPYVQSTAVAWAFGYGAGYVVNVDNSDDYAAVTFTIDPDSDDYGLHGGGGLALILICAGNLAQVHEKRSLGTPDFQIDLGAGIDELLKPVIYGKRFSKALTLYNMVTGGERYTDPKKFAQVCEDLRAEMAKDKPAEGGKTEAPVHFDVIGLPGSVGKGVSGGTLNMTLYSGTVPEVFPPVLRYSKEGKLHVNNLSSPEPYYISLKEWDYGYTVDSLRPVGIGHLRHYGKDYRLKWYPKEHDNSKDTRTGVLADAGNRKDLKGRKLYTNGWFSKTIHEDDGYLELLPTYWKGPTTEDDDEAWEPSDDLIHLVGVRAPCKGSPAKFSVRNYEIEIFGSWQTSDGKELRIWRNGDRVYGLYPGGELRGMELDKQLTEGADEHIKLDYEWYDKKLRYGRGYLEILQSACEGAGKSAFDAKWTYGRSDPKKEGTRFTGQIRNYELQVLPVPAGMSSLTNYSQRSFDGTWSRNPDVKQAVHSPKKKPWDVCSGQVLEIKHEPTTGKITGRMTYTVLFRREDSGKRRFVVELATFESLGPTKAVASDFDRLWKMPGVYSMNEIHFRWKKSPNSLQELDEAMATFDKTQDAKHPVISNRIRKPVKWVREAHQILLDNGEGRLRHLKGRILLDWKPDGKNRTLTLFS